MTEINDIFISYASQDLEIAEKLNNVLRNGRRVFFAPRILPGAEWNEELQRALHKARCVVVLWSAAARRSLWVHGEAADAFERGCYIPVSIDGTEPPRLFKQVQTPSIARWVSGGETEPLALLKNAISTRIDEPRGYGNLESVNIEADVEPRHLHLIHSCWRVDKKSEFGVMPYQIHLIIYGHETALKRIEYVEYYLPGYPKERERQRGGGEARLFELKELANGFSIAQATVNFLPRNVEGKAAIRQPSITLSRFINMSESGPRLDNFILRQLSE